MQLDIWSDVACPFCYIGKRHVEAAIEQFDGDVEVTWHAFELDPDAEAVPELSNDELLMAKYGMSRKDAEAARARVTAMAAATGLEYDLAASRPSNTFDAHRLVRFATERGLGDAMVERLFRARFMEGALLSDHEALTAMAGEVGLDAGEVGALLAGDDLTSDVRHDEALAARMGIGGVPFFVADMQFGASGAQPVEELLAFLQTAAAKGATADAPAG